jgi:hypothetical protein
MLDEVGQPPRYTHPEFEENFRGLRAFMKAEGVAHGSKK